MFRKITKKIILTQRALRIFDASMLRDPLRGKALLKANQKLVDMAIVTLHCTSSTEDASIQSAKFVLDLFRADHLRLSVPSFVYMTCYLCAYSENPKIVMDAIFNLHSFDDSSLPNEFWGHNNRLVKYISCALTCDSTKTVIYCAEILTRVMNHLSELRTDNVSLFFPAQYLRSVFRAFQSRLEDYQCAQSLESLILVLEKLGDETATIRRRQGRTGSIDMKVSSATESYGTVISFILGSKVIQSDTTRRAARCTDSFVADGTKFVPSRILNELHGRADTRNRLLRMAHDLLDRCSQLEERDRQDLIDSVRLVLDDKKYGDYMRTFLSGQLSKGAIFRLKSMVVERGSSRISVEPMPC